MAQGKDAVNTFYTDISSSDLNMICKTIAEVVNDKFVEKTVSEDER